MSKKQSNVVNIQKASGKSSSANTQSQDTAVSNDFELFWKLYPRKVGKLHARVAWNKITSGGKVVYIDGDKVDIVATPDQIMEGLHNYLFCNSNAHGDFLIEMCYTPLPQTWLNQGRFLD